MRKTVFIGIIAAAFIAGSPSSPAQAADEHNENAGIFTAQIQEDGSDIAWGQAVLVVDKPIEEVLPIIRDYANFYPLGTAEPRGASPRRRLPRR
jgi:hypothetical protein